jgi:diguanylate cyclase
VHAVPDALVSTARSFDQACAAVVDFLKDAVPLGYWSVSRYDGERQLYLQVRDDAYGLAAGDSHDWDGSLCRRMVAGGPRVAPDAMAVPEYAAAEVTRQIPIGAYVGVPIQSGDGRLFGTLCGLDPAPQDEALRECEPLLALLGSLLTTILRSELALVEVERSAERSERDAETDELTGVGNRRRWSRFLEVEGERLRRFGDPAAVLVLDLDGLKAVNDARGHAAGDDLIYLAAQVLRRQLRDHDLLARLGGDEFGIVATRILPARTPSLVARLRAALDEAGIAASIGYAPYVLTEGLGAAWEQADLNMYADKQRRRAGEGRAAA